MTVPAYLNDKQRQIVREAARSAGLDLLRIMNEQTSLLIAY